MNRNDSHTGMVFQSVYGFGAMGRFGIGIGSGPYDCGLLEGSSFSSQSRSFFTASSASLAASFTLSLTSGTSKSGASVGGSYCNGALTSTPLPVLVTDGSGPAAAGVVGAAPGGAAAGAGAGAPGAAGAAGAAGVAPDGAAPGAAGAPGAPGAGAGAGAPVVAGAEGVPPGGIGPGLCADGAAGAGTLTTGFFNIATTRGCRKWKVAVATIAVLSPPA